MSATENPKRASEGRVTGDGGGQERAVLNPASQNGGAVADLYENSNPVRHTSPFAASSLSKPIKNDDSDEEEDELRRKAMTQPPQRMVSWQDEVRGQDLVSVREFEPSESAPEVESTHWEPERKTCCTIM